MKILFTIVGILSTFTTFACTCLTPPEFKNTDDLKSYDFIALVKISNLPPIDPQRGFGVRKDGDIGIKVEELFKGDSSKTAFDQSFDSDCALGVHTGEQWLFFGNLYKGKILVGSCGYTVRYSFSEGMRNWWTGYYGPMKFLDKLRDLYGHPLMSNAVKKIYYPNTNVEVEQSFKNNKLNGVRKVYYPNGKIYMVEQFKNGERVGEKNVYFPNGQIMTHEEYEKGMIRQTILYHDTTETVWYLNFQANNSQIALFADKKRTPSQIRQRLDSLRKTANWGKQIQSIYVYSKDGRSYTRKFYTFDGKLDAETYLDWNKRITEHTMYYPDGKLRSHTIQDQIKDQELETDYNEDGTKRDFSKKCESCKFYFDPNHPEGTPDKVYVQ